MKPEIGKNCYIDENAVIIGNVHLGRGCSVWPGAVIRADLNPVRIDEGSNIQDNCVIHVSAEHGTTLGKNVSMGHNAMVHGAIVGDNVIVGINSVVLDGAVIGEGSVIGAGAVVKAGAVIPPYSLVLGVPGKVVKEGDKSLLNMTVPNAETYHRLRDEHIAGKHERYRQS